MMLKFVWSAAFIGCVLTTTGQQSPVGNFPSATWQYTVPEKLGWSSAKLELAKGAFERMNADACVVVVDGKLLAAWGDESKPIDGRSMRKFFLGSLFGAYAVDSKVDVAQTLEQLGVDDHTPLTKEEKQATVANLLTSSSGVYLAAAYEPPSNAKRRPARGSYPPGKAFYYNNWDFNALGTVFEKQTGDHLFKAFKTKIARPLQMQDFDLQHTHYIRERKSHHAAYIFETSARDDARLGWLWLNNGKWNGQQLIDSQWITDATTSKFTFTNPKRYAIRDGYGYLTWIDTDDQGRLIGYSALGNSGQYLYISVKYQAVIVLRADPGSIFRKWLGLRVDPKESYQLINTILEAAQ